MYASVFFGLSSIFTSGSGEICYEVIHLVLPGPSSQTLQSAVMHGMSCLFSRRFTFPVLWE